MAEQTSPHHFEFIGVDVIADETHRPWIIERTYLRAVFRANVIFVGCELCSALNFPSVCCTRSKPPTWPVELEIEHRGGGYHVQRDDAGLHAVIASSRFGTFLLRGVLLVARHVSCSSELPCRVTALGLATHDSRSKSSKFELVKKSSSQVRCCLFLGDDEVAHANSPFPCSSSSITKQANTKSTQPFLNIFRWKAFVAKNKAKVHV